MCGLIGMAGRLPQPDVCAAAVERLRHRGPDGRGEVRLACSGTEVWLGHTRLSILDLSDAGAQPMSSRDGRWWVVFNGEIYNHEDLRAALPGPWRGHSDTETLVEALAAWGPQRTLPMLNGMFAFAAVDLSARRLFLARDPLGVKPLYYSHADGVVTFASGIRALVGLTGRTHAIDRDALQTFLSLRFVPSPHTLLEGVERLPPGHCAAVDLASGRIDIACYIEPTDERFDGSIDEAVEAYAALVRRAVHRQMLSDVPVGVLLSGGVDSAFVAALAAALVPDTQCFSVGFGPGFPECELADAAETARVLGLPMHPVAVTHDDLWAAFEPCIASIEEPLGTASVLPMWHLARRASRSVKVVLTGQGSDEPWGGYRRYQAELWRNVPFLRYIARSALPVAEALPGVPEHLLRALNGMPVADTGRRFEREYCLFTGPERLSLTGRRDSGRAIERIGYWLRWREASDDADGAESMMSIDSRMGLADDLLLYGDKVSMAHSLEARVPMLDLELVRFVESLPRHYRVTLRRGKIVHKQAAGRCLPPEIVHRRKKAFHMPFGRWIRTAWKERAAAVLFERNAPHLDWVSAEGVRRIWEEHQRGTRDRSRQLFALLAFAFWCRTMQGVVGVRQAGRRSVNE